MELDRPLGFCVSYVDPRGEGRNLFTSFGNATSSEYDFRFRVTTFDAAEVDCRVFAGTLVTRVVTLVVDAISLGFREGEKKLRSVPVGRADGEESMVVE